MITKIKSAKLLITPKLSDFSSLSTNQTEELIEIGYKEGKKKLQKLL